MPATRLLWLHLGEIARRLAAARLLFVAADYDGTLTPIVRRPGAARLDSRARRVLATLARTPGAHVAVLSGRALDDLRARVSVPGVFLSGSAGLETLDPRGRRRRYLSAGRELSGALRAALGDWCARFPGAWLEDKGPSLALHFRELAPRLQAGFLAGARRRAAAARPRARVLAGKRVLEVFPDVAWNKDSALRAWRARGGGGLLFYFGDDANDEPALAGAARRGGIAVAVGRVRTPTPYRVESPADVVWFLEWLAREWVA
jgi:trehalose-phosphatase